MMKLKKLLSLALALGLASSLAACSSQGTSGASPTPAGSDPVPASDTTLSVLIVSDLEPLEPVFQEFAQANGISIQIESVPYSEIFNTIEVRLGTGESSVDVLVADAPLITNYAAKNYLGSMSEYISADSTSRITSASLAGGTVDGEIMALPLYSSCVNLYYNKDLFDAKGLPYPSIDPSERLTWEEIVTLAQQLTYTDENGSQIYGLTFEQIDTPYQLLPLSQSLGAVQYINDDQTSTEGYTNAEAVVKAGQFYYDTFNTWNISPKIDGSESTGYFTAGQVAMFVGGSWQISSMDSAGMNWGVAPHPYFEGGEAVTPTGSWYMGVSNYSENKELASKFVEWLTTDDETCQKTYSIMQNLPCNISVLDSIEQDSANEGTVAALNVYEAMNTAVARPQMVGYEEWQSVMQETYSDIKNGSDPQAALDAAVEEIDSLIAKYQQ